MNNKIRECYVLIVQIVKNIKQNYKMSLQYRMWCAFFQIHVITQHVNSASKQDRISDSNIAIYISLPACFE